MSLIIKVGNRVYETFDKLEFHASEGYVYIVKEAYNSGPTSGDLQQWADLRRPTTVGRPQEAYNSGPTSGGLHKSTCTQCDKGQNRTTSI